MKKFITGSVVAAVLTIGSIGVVSSQEPAVTPPDKVNATPGMLTNMIDDINVPWEILEYIQMKYEGHAVTKADKITRGGKDFYRLRVDRDSVPTDYESIAVMFDMQWKLVGEEKYQAPPPKPAPKVEEPAASKPVEENAERGGEEQKPDPKEEERPDEKPVEEEPESTPAEENPTTTN